MVEFGVWAGLVRVAFRFGVEFVRVAFGSRKEVARTVLGPRKEVAPEVFGRWTELAVYGSPAAVQICRLDCGLVWNVRLFRCASRR